MATALQCFLEAMALLRPTTDRDVVNAALYDIASGLNNLALQVSDLEQKTERIERLLINRQ
jgi:hypothetical protein